MNLDPTPAGRLNAILLLGYIYGKEERAVALADEVSERYERVVGVTGKKVDAEKPVVAHLTKYTSLYLAGSRTTGEGIVMAAGAKAAGMSVFEASHPGGRAGAAEPARVIEEVGPSLVFLCNPNNPTGQLCTREEVERLGQAVAAGGGRLVEDEAYMPFAWPEEEAATPGGGLMVLRSLTKLHAVPGLRLGFLLGDRADVAAVEAQQPPWSVSAPAAAAGFAALDLDDFCRESVQRVAATRARLLDALEAASFAVKPSLGNFLMVEVGDGGGFVRRCWSGDSWFETARRLACRRGCGSRCHTRR